MREALLVNAKFVVSQLEAMGGTAPISRNAVSYRHSVFGEAMAAEVCVVCLLYLCRCLVAWLELFVCYICVIVWCHGEKS